MKKLITATDLKNMLGAGQTEIYVQPGTIITPAAKDVAAESKVEIIYGCPPENSVEVACQNQVQVNEATAGAEPATDSVMKMDNIPQHLIAEIVKKVLDSMPGLQPKEEMVKESDPSGVTLVKGGTVKCESFNTGNPRDKVGIKEILTTKESPNMCTGFMEIEDASSFSWLLKYEELDYVIDGTLDIIVNGKTYRGHAGDVLYIPRDTEVTFSTPDNAKFFFVTYPANWAELSNYEK